MNTGYIHLCAYFSYHILIYFKFTFSIIYISTFSITMLLMICQHFRSFTQANHYFLSLKSSCHLLWKLEDCFGSSQVTTASGSRSSDPGRTECCSSPNGFLFQYMVLLISTLSLGSNQVTCTVQLSTVARFLTLLRIWGAILMFKIWVLSHIQTKEISPGTAQ